MHRTTPRAARADRTSDTERLAARLLWTKEEAAAVLAPETAVHAAPQPAAQPDDAPDYLREYHAGWSSIQEGKPKEAVDRFRRAVFLNDRFVAGEISMAMAYQQLGESEASARHYARALGALERLGPDERVYGFEEPVVWLRGLVREAIQRVAGGSDG